MLATVHDGGDWPFFPAERFVHAANVLNGTRPDRGPDYKILLALARSPFVHNPRDSSKIDWLFEKLAECFGWAFGSMDRTPVVAALDKAFERAKGLNSRRLDGDRKADPERAVHGFARDLVWFAYLHAKQRGAVADPACFRFPMPSRPTKDKLLVAIQNYARDKRERSRRSTE